jgi:hypothetical protein
MYEVTLRDRTREMIEGADAYRQEGQMTTFFRRENGREVVDCWSTRVASFRTSEVLIIRRLLHPDTISLPYGSLERAVERPPEASPPAAASFDSQPRDAHAVHPATISPSRL